MRTLCWTNVWRPIISFSKRTARMSYRLSLLLAFVCLWFTSTFDRVCTCSQKMILMPLVQVAVALSLCAVPPTGWLDGTRPVARPAQ